jgi:hypothetical protein
MRERVVMDFWGRPCGSTQLGVPKRPRPYLAAFLGRGPPTVHICVFGRWALWGKRKFLWLLPVFGFRSLIGYLPVWPRLAGGHPLLAGTAST